VDCHHELGVSLLLFPLVVAGGLLLGEFCSQKPDAKKYELWRQSRASCSYGYYPYDFSVAGGGGFFHDISSHLPLSVVEFSCQQETLVCSHDVPLCFLNSPNLSLGQIWKHDVKTLMKVGPRRNPSFVKH